MNTKQLARFSGLLYLIIIFSAGFNFAYLHEVIFSSEGAETLQNLQNNMIGFRLAISAGFLAVIADIILATCFYYLLRPTSKILSLITSYFRILQSFLMAAGSFFLLPFLISSTIAPETTSLLFTSHNLAFDIAMLFFGVHCLFLGYLFIRSQEFPKWLGSLVILAGASYSIDSSITLLLPQYSGSSEIMVTTLAIIAEFTLCGYLLIKGVQTTNN